jgi:hypothetical protein
VLHLDVELRIVLSTENGVSRASAYILRQKIELCISYTIDSYNTTKVKNPKFWLVWRVLGEYFGGIEEISLRKGGTGVLGRPGSSID